MAWPAPAWDEPAVLAFVGEGCVAGINWSRDEKQLTVNIDFAWCDPDQPFGLAACLIALRRRLRSEPVLEVCFTCHPENAEMMKLVAKLKLQPKSMSFRVPVDKLRTP